MITKDYKRVNGTLSGIDTTVTVLRTTGMIRVPRTFGGGNRQYHLQGSCKFHVRIDTIDEDALVAIPDWEPVLITGETWDNVLLDGELVYSGLTEWVRFNPNRV